MTSQRYTEEFKQEAITQITERGRSVADVSQSFGRILYAWMKRYGKPEAKSQKNRTC